MNLPTFNNLAISLRVGDQRRPPSREGASIADTLSYDIILSIIFHLVDDQSTQHAPWLQAKTIRQPALYKVALINKAWNDAAGQLLYKDVFLANPRALARFSLTMLNRERLREHVKSLFFTCAYSENGVGWLGFEIWWDLERIYSLCPNLHSRTVKTRLSKDSRFPKAVITRARGLHERQCQSVDTERLTRLELEPFETLSATLFSRAVSLPSLEDLVIKNYRRKFEGFDAPKKPLEWPAMPRLRRLCLYRCAFLEPFMSLPSFEPGRNGLRALEIVGGTYRSIDLWEKILTIGQSLELLTFGPVHSTKPPEDALRNLPSLVVLRINPAYFSYLLSSQFPPRLVHLVSIEMSTRDTIWYVMDCVARLVEGRKSDEACKYLKSISIYGRITDEARTRQPTLTEKAEEAGIKFTMEKAASRWSDNIGRLLYRVSPVF